MCYSGGKTTNWSQRQFALKRFSWMVVLGMSKSAVRTAQLFRQHPLSVVRRVLAPPHPRAGPYVGEVHPRSKLERLTNRAILERKVLSIAGALESGRGQRDFLRNTPRQVDVHVATACRQMLQPHPPSNEDGRRSVLILAEPGAAFCAAITAVWALNRMAVPLSHSNPAPELAYVVQDCGATTLLCTPATLALARQVMNEAKRRVRIIVIGSPARGTVNRKDIAQPSERKLKLAQASMIWTRRSLSRRAKAANAGSSAEMHSRMDALMIYTSGTTGKPKGVVHTFASLENQVQILRQAWKWNSGDHILNPLPLHHVHGLVNITMCALASSARVTFAYPFDASFTFSRLLCGDVTLFMAVPPAYAKLLSYVRNRSDATVAQQTFALCVSQDVRLFVSGSSALPVTVRNDVERLLGRHVILERYGMTEIGMALSQPYPPAKGSAGDVGSPLPSVQCRVVDENGADVQEVNERQGELLVASPSVFNRYWNRTEATRKSFVTTGKMKWYVTGDAVIATKQPNGQWKYRIAGRLSADILKVSSFKISALEIEAELLDSGLVEEIAVFGVQHAGDVSDTVVAVLKPTARTSERQIIEQLKRFAAEHLAKYKRPKHYVVLRQPIPRNAMGKVNKKHLAAQYADGRLAEFQ
jgi:malonyl-CoA/methylmalonyl-CoA synthetase